MTSYEARFEKEKEKIFEDYFTFLRFPSIATDPAYKQEVLKCADWLCHYMQESGLKVEKWQTDHAPTLFAYNLEAGADKKTLLIYGHYDVQPVDPLDEWITPPFEPTIRDGEVYARGASDDKGQCFYSIIALKHLIEKMGTLPINVKFLIEGEEESGSYGLSKLLKTKKEALKADYLLIVDSGLEEADTPAITLGARGLVCLEATLQEAKIDMHSGMVGGVAYNPNRALAQLIAKLHDENGRVAVAGFYEDVTPISPEDKKCIDFEFDPLQFESMFGFLPTRIQNNMAPNEARWLQPTLEINGMWGGYTGAGFKTVIPAKAHMKLSCRLVPGQIPEKIAQQVSDFLMQNKPAGFELKITRHHGDGKGFRTNPNSDFANLMCESYSAVFSKPCKKILIGGSIPISVELADASGAEMVLIGLGLPDDYIHAPNEHFGLDRFKKGYLTICQTIELFAKSR